MARDHAQLLHRIWTDQEFLALPSASQRAYMLLVSQPSMNYAGVLDLTVGRWARYAPDTNAEAVHGALTVLAINRFVVIDYDTEEVLVRTFIRNDGLWRNVRMLRVAIREALTTQSAALRAVLSGELAALPPIPPPRPDKSGNVSERALAESAECEAELVAAIATMGAPTAAPGSAPARPPAAAPGLAPAATHSPAPAAAPADDVPPAPGAGAPRARADGDGDGAVVGEGEHPVEYREGDVPEADAGARGDRQLRVAGWVDIPGRVVGVDDQGHVVGVVDVEQSAVPDTATPPQDDHTEPRRSAPAPAHRENAMPPARCRNHLDLVDDKPCGRCKDARKAQEAWIADRDAKMARARAEAQAEIAAQRDAERAAIARCSRCDDRGVTPGGVRCTHDDRADVSPGRAAFRAERERLRQRQEERNRTDDKPPATGEQLRLLAIRFGERGVNDRATRLQICGDVVGRPITSTRDLTRAEATVLLDRFEHPLPADPPPDDVVDVDVYCGTEGCTLLDGHDGPCPVGDPPPDAPGTVHPEVAADQGGQAPVEDPVDEDPSLDVDLSDPDAVAAATPPHERGVCPDCADGDHCRSCDCCDQDEDEPPDDEVGSWDDDADVAYSYAGGPDDPPF